MVEQVSGDCDDEDGCGGSGSGEVKRTLKITNWMPDGTNFTDVKQIHHTGSSSTLDATGAGCVAGTQPMTFILMGVLMLLLGLW
ncbi:glypican 5 [Ictidomys tridecemlineatus]|nr:glypican 5 [Ictidomys tridecemlineatus]